MQIKIEKLPNARVKLNIEVPKEEVKKFFDAAYEKLSKTVNIKGFRPGKAPRLMVIDAVGVNRYNSEALDLALPQTYFSVIQQEKIVPIMQPKVNIKQFGEDSDFIYQAEVDVAPKTKLGDYRKLKIKNEKLKIKYKAKDEEIEKVVKRLLYQAAKYKDVDRSAKAGDRIEINFDGYIKHVQQENYCSKHYPLILGEKVLIPGFEEKLEGMKKDESKRFELEIKKGEKEEIIEFEVKINIVQEVELPELDDEFAKRFGHSSPEKLKEAIGKGIVSEKEMTDRQALEQEVLDKVVAQCESEVPQSLVEQEINRKISEIQGRMGPGWQQYLEKIGKSVENLRTELRQGAQKAVKTGLVLGEIGKDLGIIKGRPKDEKDQRELVRKTIDKLVEITTTK